MTDSSSFSSLFALVDSHLSKTNIQNENQASTSRPFKLPTFNVQRGLSDIGLPSTSGLSSSSMNFPLPRLSLSDRPINSVLGSQFSSMCQTNETKQDAKSDTAPLCMSDYPINDVLAIQLSNMFKARAAEKKKVQELQEAQETLQKLQLEEQNQASCLIDLMPAVQLPGQVQNQLVNTLSSSSSMESIVIPDTLEVVEEDLEVQPEVEIPPRPVSPLLPITTDMSYILKHKIGKCSEFGKVLCARYRPVAAPYFREPVSLKKVKVFDFSTPSPDDIILERLRRPFSYTNNRAISVYE